MIGRLNSVFDGSAENADSKARANNLRQLCKGSDVDNFSTTPFSSRSRMLVRRACAALAATVSAARDLAEARSLGSPGVAADSSRTLSSAGCAAGVLRVRRAAERLPLADEESVRSEQEGY